ncbi:MAG TPA: branched-chain amino acid ABC transporter permease [Bradyrhizobium sp.]|jgi:branched-chain amino acid transport system permease protein|nr:branched-chain amino acid ABC transporter permease [Bradyrhizobium sp.]
MVTTALQIVADGLLLGMIYAVVGLGLSLLLGIMGIINVAHSAFIMLGAFFTLGMLEALHVDPIFSFALAVPLFFAVGALVFRLIIVRMERAEQNQGLVAMFGLMVLIENVGTIFWTTNTRVVTVAYSNIQLKLGLVSVPAVRVIAGALAAALIAAFWLFLNRSLIGRAIRAMAQNQDAAAAIGINVTKLSLVMFGLGIASAGAAGVVIAMVFPFAPQTQIEWLSWAFLIVILGGFGRVENTLAAGLLTGLIQTIATALMPFDYVYLLLYVALASVLVLRREGLRGAVRRTI